MYTLSGPSLYKTKKRTTPTYRLEARNSGGARVADNLAKEEEEKEEEEGGLKIEASM